MQAWGKGPANRPLIGKKPLRRWLPGRCCGWGGAAGEGSQGPPGATRATATPHLAAFVPELLGLGGHSQCGASRNAANRKKTRALSVGSSELQAFPANSPPLFHSKSIIQELAEEPDDVTTNITRQRSGKGDARPRDAAWEGKDACQAAQW